MFFMFFFVLLYVSTASADESIVLASWYGSPDLEGNPMANGRPFKSTDPTIAAHPTLPLGTKLEIKNPANGRKLKVRVQDRGPYVNGRELDLSRAAAKKLGYATKGVTKLAVSVVD